MQIGDIFDALINSPDMVIELQLKADIYNEAEIEKLKRSISSYKFRNKSLYEEVLGNFELQYSLTRSEEETGQHILKIEISTVVDKSKYLDGVQINGN